MNNGMPVVTVKNNGTMNGPIVLTNYPGDRPKLEFDSEAAISVSNGAFLEISGFEISGPN